MSGFRNFLAPKISKGRVLIALAVVVIAVLFFTRARWMTWLGDFLILDDHLQPADVIYVIGGKDYRTDHAVHLFQQGYAGTLFFSGGWCRFHNYFHGLRAQDRSRAQGVPAEAIVIDDTSVSSTYQEAERLRDWIDHRPSRVRSVIVVSDPFHIRRARWAFRRVLGGRVRLQMAPVPFEMTPFRRRWWTDPASRAYVESEYGKYPYYILRYQLSRGPLRRWLASLDKS
jgi:uncharacterized SAM-binding protein YcdF (DUF218 family)